MTLEVIVTGTGTPNLHADRAGPGVLVRVHDDERVVNLQFDAGRGTVMRLTGAGVRPEELTALFITHHHSDHLMDLQDVVLTRWILGESADPLPVVAPEGPTSRFVQRMLEPWREDIEVRAAHMYRQAGPDVVQHPFTPSQEPTVVWQVGQVVVSAVAVAHEPVVDAVAYRVDTPSGSVVISGDTAVCAQIEALAEGANVLVHEALRTALLSDNERGKFTENLVSYHADTVELGAMAKRLGVPHLLLTHLIPQPRTDAEVQAFADDVRAGGYDGDVRVCSDLDSIMIGADA